MRSCQSDQGLQCLKTVIVFVQSKIGQVHCRNDIREDPILGGLTEADRK